MIGIPRDNEGVAENDVQHMDFSKMSIMKNEIIDLVTEREIITVLEVVDIMVTRGYWVQAVKMMLVNMINSVGILKHFVHGDDQDSNVLVSYHTLVAKTHISHRMNRLQDEYNEVVAERVRNIRF